MDSGSSSGNSGSSSQQGNGNHRKDSDSEVKKDEITQIIATLPNKEYLKDVPDL